MMGRHAAYWRPFIDSGQMVAFGPVLDDRDRGGSVSSKPWARTSCGRLLHATRRSPAEPPSERSESCSPGFVRPR